MNDLAAIRPYSGAGAKTAGAPAARRGKPPDALGVAVILCKGPADHLAAKLPPTLWMFSNTRAFNQPLNNWNVSKVTDMECMFSNTRAFNQPLNSWNVSNVTDMSGMFSATRSFNQPLHAPWYH